MLQNFGTKKTWIPRHFFLNNWVTFNLGFDSNLGFINQIKAADYFHQFFIAGIANRCTWGRLAVAARTVCPDSNKLWQWLRLAWTFIQMFAQLFWVASVLRIIRTFDAAFSWNFIWKCEKKKISLHHTWFQGGVLGCLGLTHHLKKSPLSFLANPRDFHKSVVKIFNKYWWFFWPPPPRFVDKNHDPTSYFNFFYSI